MITEKELKVINDLTDVIQGLETKKEKDDVAYLIHRIIEGDKIDYNGIASWKLQANKDIFMKVSE